MGRLADLRRKVTDARRDRGGGRVTSFPSPRWGCSTCDAELADVLVLIGVPSGELVQEPFCWGCFDPADYPEARYEVFPGRPRHRPHQRKAR